MKVITNTTFTPYNKDVQIKPLHPVWIIKNTGYFDCFINGSIRLHPGDFFGIDTSPLLIPVIQSHIKKGEKITLTNDTQFSVSFPPFDSQGNQYYAQATLIETSFTIK